MGIIYNYTYKERPVPEIGKKYHFFDDGKISPGRHSIATVKRLLTKDEAKNIIISSPRGVSTTNENVFINISLYDIWCEEVKEYDWIISEDTDYIIEADIPEYDEDKIYFVRSKDGGWFSMNTTNWWQSGRLDVEGDLYESIKEYF